jgi:hypothetical protein
VRKSLAFFSRPQPFFPALTPGRPKNSLSSLIFCIIPEAVYKRPQTFSIFAAKEKIFLAQKHF